MSTAICIERSVTPFSIQWRLFGQNVGGVVTPLQILGRGKKVYKARELPRGRGARILVVCARTSLVQVRILVVCARILDVCARVLVVCTLSLTFKMHEHQPPNSSKV